MQIKTAVIALVSLSAVAEASLIHRHPVGLARRQGGGFGGGFGGGGFGGGNGGGGNGGNGGGNAQGNGQGNGQGNAQGNGQDNAQDDGQDNAQDQNGQDDGQDANDGGNNAGGNNAGTLTLSPDAVQTGSQSTGQENGGADGQVESATDDANFINFCDGEDLTNGEQKEGGSCNGIVMGKIPATNKMVSSVFTNPQNGDDIAANQDFDIQISIANMQLGSFTNATSTYYSAPQDLDGSGVIIGHTHVTVQDTGNSLNPTQPLDATQFAFFKGINDAGDGQGNLKATVTGGLPAGNYRLCSMSSASNHQPVIMAVAQRGAQDDCVRFTVGGNGGGGGNNGGNGQGNQDDQNQDDAQQGNDQDQNQDDAQQDDAQQGNGQGQNAGGNGQNGGNGGFGGGNGGFGGGNGGFGGGNGGGFGQGKLQPGQSGKAGNSGNNNNDGLSNQGNNGNGNNGGNSNNGAGSSTTGAPDPTDAVNPSQTSTASQASATLSSGGNVDGGDGGSSFQAIGGIAAPSVSDSGNGDRPFEVNGNTFTTKSGAVQRACDIQQNACADAVNSGKLSGLSVSDCGAQVSACVTALS